jgi:hypothetical protein
VGIGICDVRFGLGQFGLAKLHNGSQAEVVTRLREVECQTGLLAQLARDVQTLVGAIGVLPGDAHVAGDVIAQVGKFLAGDFSLQVGSFGPSVVEKAVEDRDVDVDSGRATTTSATMAPTIRVLVIA